MLSKKNRLKKGADFKRVFKEGKGFKDGFLFLKIVKNNLGESRFGFVVGKRFSKKSFLRNKTKRKLQELVRIEINKIKKKIDGVIIVSPGLGIKNSREIEESLGRLFRKSGLL